MEATLKKQIINKLEKLPNDRIPQVLDFIEFILAKYSNESTQIIEATDKDIIRTLEDSGSLDFYYDDTQNVYTLEDGEPL